MKKKSQFYGTTTSERKEKIPKDNDKQTLQNINISRYFILNYPNIALKAFFFSQYSGGLSNI